MSKKQEEDRRVEKLIERARRGEDANSLRLRLDRHEDSLFSHLECLRNDLMNAPPRADDRYMVDFSMSVDVRDFLVMLINEHVLKGRQGPPYSPLQCIGCILWIGVEAFREDHDSKHVSGEIIDPLLVKRAIRVAEWKFPGMFDPEEPYDRDTIRKTLQDGQPSAGIRGFVDLYFPDAKEQMRLSQADLERHRV